MQIDLDRYINERELFEAKNLARVVQYINKKATEKELSMEIILLLHKMLISNIRDDIAGRFRNDDEWVRVANHIAPNPKEVTGLLKEMLADYHASDSESIVSRVAKLHLTFENIHPFVDGNGRIGRVINNYVLIRENYVPINIKFINRTEYYAAFQEFDKSGTTHIMEEIVSKAVSQSYHKRLAYLEGKKIITLTDYAKQQKISHSNLLNKANRQTIEAFFGKGRMENWSLKKLSKHISKIILLHYISLNSFQKEFCHRGIKKQIFNHIYMLKCALAEPSLSALTTSKTQQSIF